MKVVSIAKLRVNDRGKFHNQTISFKLKIDYSEGHPYESILIQYGIRKDFLICGCYNLAAPADHVFLSAVNVGNGKDILISEYEWLNILEQLGSKEKLQYWKEIFNVKKIQS